MWRLPPTPQPTPWPGHQPGWDHTPSKSLCMTKYRKIRQWQRKKPSFLLFVLFLNKYELTAFLCIRLLIKSGGKMRNICKFFSYHPPNFAWSELNPDSNRSELLTGWAVPTAAQRVLLPQAHFCWGCWLTGVVNVLFRAAMPNGQCSWGGVEGREGAWVGRTRPARATLPFLILWPDWTSHFPSVGPVFWSRKWVRPENLRSLFHQWGSRILRIRSIISIWTFPCHA